MTPPHGTLPGISAEPAHRVSGGAQDNGCAQVGADPLSIEDVTRVARDGWPVLLYPDIREAICLVRSGSLVRASLAASSEVSSC